ncbi:hypothetical protein BU24DRAFT_197523 [Aaosphaeria arxii CBS 175.79]|uniref:Uncharacterized protein n=1 Tax=Aaosphaeria arxii CBS 175.79 TaxID=1450172 RepID=A0A6A5XST9_9PLEO|nr:uncharacterized protein BU24DRAFT_197523 [Aaosphaeria arxii CBS 175.79]KAF2016262.1 hypothetical protein BU24DRAFT_197523 [Aaosphaeria arxii CBS 175.79]
MNSKKSTSIIPHPPLRIIVTAGPSARLHACNNATLALDEDQPNEREREQPIVEFSRHPSCPAKSSQTESERDKPANHPSASGAGEKETWGKNRTSIKFTTLSQTCMKEPLYAPLIFDIPTQTTSRRKGSASSITTCLVVVIRTSSLAHTYTRIAW